MIHVFVYVTRPTKLVVSHSNYTFKTTPVLVTPSGHRFIDRGYIVRCHPKFKCGKIMMFKITVVGSVDQYLKTFLF